MCVWEEQLRAKSKDYPEGQDDPLVNMAFGKDAPKLEEFLTVFK